MKLRIRDNSIRLRLTRPEVVEFASRGRLTSRIGFPGSGLLSYELGVTEGNAVTARFDGATISVEVPGGAVRSWAASDQVSIAADLPLAGGSTLGILIEKDFACLTPREGEDESQMFPHPEAG